MLSLKHLSSREVGGWNVVMSGRFPAYNTGKLERQVEWTKVQKFFDLRRKKFAAIYQRDEARVEISVRRGSTCSPGASNGLTKIRSC